MHHVFLWTYNMSAENNIFLAGTLWTYNMSAENNIFLAGTLSVIPSRKKGGEEEKNNIRFS